MPIAYTAPGLYIHKKTHFIPPYCPYKTDAVFSLWKMSTLNKHCLMFVKTVRSLETMEIVHSHQTVLRLKKPLFSILKMVLYI